MILLKNVSKEYSDKNTSVQALHDISLNIRSGEVVGLLGRSGAGKSTLLRLINGLEKPSQGEVSVKGRLVPYNNTKELRAHRKTIGMVFQQANLLYNLNVEDNICLPLTLSDYKDHFEIDELLKFVGLSDQKHKYPSQLSGGQMQRVGIARALVTKPEILLCDEPTSALDEYTTVDIIDLLKRINESFGTTILIVTHELSVARALCERVIVLEEGNLVDEIKVETNYQLKKADSYLAYVHEYLGGGVDV